MLARQREFVADASHELRTPLTSVLANLDFLAETLDGEQGEAARVGAALLAADAPARRRTCCCSPAPTPSAPRPHQPLDVGQVVVEAAAELEPVTEGHDAHRRRAARDGRRRARRAAPPRR